MNSTVSLSVERSSLTSKTNKKATEKNIWDFSTIETSIPGLENKKTEPLQNSLYSLSNAYGINSANESNNRTEHFNERENMPKIITVKGFTSQKQELVFLKYK